MGMSAGTITFMIGIAGAIGTFLAMLIYNLLAKRACKRLKKQLEEVYKG